MDIGDNSLASGPDGKKRKVAYFDREDVGMYFYGQGHDMKPLRITMTHELVKHYGLLEHMQHLKPPLATDSDFLRFHADDYVKFLKEVTPEKMEHMHEQLTRFNFGTDSPVFDDLYDFCRTYAAGSICGAQKLNEKKCDIAINWAGGLHHAKKCGASGFCYINDVVLAILNLLQDHERVLYVDIDVHHGDGVEDAFYTTDRVMTVSFHKFGGSFFPKTGDIKDIGSEKGKYYSLNVPLKDGIDDESYQFLFKPIIGKVMEVFDPKAVVLQCGADSLSGDRLGCFNLSIKGHGECVKFIRSFNIPLLLLGGGGYTMGNVARCWSYETAVAVNKENELPDKVPTNDFYHFYLPDKRLHVQPSRMENRNKRIEMDNLKSELLHNLAKLKHVPSVQFQDRIHYANEMAEDDGEAQSEQMMQFD